MWQKPNRLQMGNSIFYALALLVDTCQNDRRNVVAFMHHTSPNRKSTVLQAKQPTAVRKLQGSHLTKPTGTAKEIHIEKTKLVVVNIQGHNLITTHYQ